MGYELGFGHKWRDTYLVADLSDFLDLDLQQDALPGPWSKVYPHKTRKVVIPSWGIRFPLKNAYDIRNCSFDAMKAKPSIAQKDLDDVTPPIEDHPIDPDYVAPSTEGDDPFAFVVAADNSAGSGGDPAVPIS